MAATAYHGWVSWECSDSSIAKPMLILILEGSYYALTLVNIQVTIVSTSLVKITNDLHGFD